MTRLFYYIGGGGFSLNLPLSALPYFHGSSYSVTIVEALEVIKETEPAKDIKVIKTKAGEK